ncbi:hypothetical protein FIBSPDRAFT_1046540 [Athelia psychrophila]|uniref:Ribonuclease H2 subunit B n=1 Tax=Athelia psychrophila TaxID=1759441 RepID=A0A166GMV0_9AGAM|nr:hypothetical protein FIBSPDRAFT_1046540 [Fibularhizoctonia sp. CBS 109695]
MNSPNIGILPSDVLDVLAAQLSNESAAPAASRFLRLPHPRTGIASLFLPYETKSEPKEDRILEVQAVAPVNARSWFLGQSEVVADGKMLVMTPIDPVFLLIPILKAAHPQDGSLGSFRPADDMFEEAATQLSKVNPDEKDPSARLPSKDILHLFTLPCVRKALKRACDVKEITPEIVVYRFSAPRLEEYLQLKVARLGAQDVTESSRTLLRKLAMEGLMEDGKEDLLKMGRVKATCDLLSQYIPPDIYSSLLASYDFTKLDAYLKSAHDEATLATVTASSSKGKKTKGEDEKEDKKRKVAVKASQGVDKLKKANISGMAKMSSFFKKAT